MPDTFEDVWRRAALQLPGVDALLVRDWAQDAYLDACTRRGWSWLRKESAISTLASRTATVTFTQGSTAITSAALFVATDAGRQIRVDNLPAYTIVSVTNASAAVIDRAYAADSGAETATILDLYAIMPADFSRFRLVLDPYNQRPIDFTSSVDQLALADPALTSSDSGPRFLVSATFSPATATLGQVRYQLWPAPTSARQYPFLYYRKGERFSETSTLPGVFSNRADVLKLGTLVQAAGWPGTVDQKNPYYALEHQDRLARKFEDQLQKLSLEDDNQYPEDVLQVDWASRYGGLTPSTSWLRQTDATVADYY